MIVTLISNLAGSAINAVCVIAGGILGLIFKGKLPEKYSKSVMSGLGLCVMFIGISGAFKGNHTLIMVLSVVIGIIIGELMKLQESLDRLGLAIQNKFGRKNSGENSFAEGFISAALVFCVGSMTVLGAVQSAVGEGFSRHMTLIVKGVLDFVSATVFASSFGIGVIFSSVFVFVFQGLITVLASFLGEFLSADMIAEMTCVGSIILIAIGLNMLGITKIKTVNFVPGMFIAILFTYLASLLGILQYV